MIQKITKTNDSLAYFNTRLDAIHMNACERLRAKARYAQAEAMVDATFALIALAKRLLKAMVLRPYRRLTTAG